MEVLDVDPGGSDRKGRYAADRDGAGGRARGEDMLAEAGAPVAAGAVTDRDRYDVLGGEEVGERENDQDQDQKWIWPEMPTNGAGSVLVSVTRVPPESSSLNSCQMTAPPEMERVIEGV